MPSKKTAPPRRASSRQESHARPHVHLIDALDSIGWRVVEMRPERLDGRAALWHVGIARVDDVASMTAIASDPDAALGELVRYTAIDAENRR